jgi:hypothetical protein
LFHVAEEIALPLAGEAEAVSELALWVYWVESDEKCDEGDSKKDDKNLPVAVEEGTGFVGRTHNCNLLWVSPMVTEEAGSLNRDSVSDSSGSANVNLPDVPRIDAFRARTIFPFDDRKG